MKIWNYVVISVFLALLFQMAGFSVASSLLDRIGINLDTGVAGFKSSTFWTALVILLGSATVAGVSVGYITKSSSENYVILPFIIAEIFLFSSVMIGIISNYNSLAKDTRSPLIVGFGIAIYEHFRGTD